MPGEKRDAEKLKADLMKVLKGLESEVAGDGDIEVASKGGFEAA